MLKVKDISKSNDKKYKHLYSEDKTKALTEQKFLMKENSYQICLVELIEKSILDNDQNLSINFLKSLSQNILNNNLTDDLSTSGLIHGLLMNFKNNFKEIIKYFNDFVEYFGKSDQNFILIKINQIKLINLFIIIIEEYNKTNVYNVEGKIHNNLINLILFWLHNVKDQKITRNENILKILIKAIKRIEYLKLLKVILLAAIKFIMEKRILLKGINDDIAESLNTLDPKIFKVDFLFNEVPNLNFKEDTKLLYNFEANHLEYYEAELFMLLHKIEKKIKDYSNLLWKKESF